MKRIMYEEIIAKKFAKELVKRIRDLGDTLYSLDSKFKDVVPEPFNNKHLIIDIYYSLHIGNFFINYKKNTGNRDNINFHLVNGNGLPFNIFRVEEPQKIDSNEKIFSANIMGGGSLMDDHHTIEIGFSILTSQIGMAKSIKFVEEKALQIVRHEIEKQKNQQYKERVSYYNKINNLYKKMNTLISSEKTLESDIDRFLMENPIILKEGLNLVELHHQVNLDNILGKYEHNLKPDLIAFDLTQKNWAIVDYKRSKKSILKNVGKVRTSFKSEVRDLESQLLDYVEYFQENEHRSYIKEKYGIDIKYPIAIGIIGNVYSQERDAFNRLSHGLPKWCNIVPYNYLLDNFGRYVLDYGENLLKMR